MDLALGIGSIVIAFVGVSVNALGIRVKLARPILPTLPRLPLIGRLINWLIARGQWILVESPGAQGFKLGFVFGLGTAATVIGMVGAIIFLPSALCEDGPDVRVLSPSDGDAVPHEISVEGKARVRADDEFLVVFVRPLPNDPRQDYWAQQLPQQIDERQWVASPVYVGAPDDQPGTPFKVCAVITKSEISPGERFRMLPPGPYDCVLVTRE